MRGNGHWVSNPSENMKTIASQNSRPNIQQKNGRTAYLTIFINLQTAMFQANLGQLNSNIAFITPEILKYVHTVDSWLHVYALQNCSNIHQNINGDKYLQHANKTQYKHTHDRQIIYSVNNINNLSNVILNSVVQNTFTSFQLFNRFMNLKADCDFVCKVTTGNTSKITKRFAELTTSIHFQPTAQCTSQIITEAQVHEAFDIQ